MYNTDCFEPVCFRANGTLELNGRTIAYETVCEDNVFYDELGRPIASIFSYSYFRTDVERPSGRPVLFCFNGGPGASSMMVHAGCFGAKRVKYPESPEIHTALPPYEVIDNPDCLLDAADLVMVDPIATGFGLLLNQDSGKRFFGIDEDAEALVMFIARWLSRYNRWNSPKYLVGESYGCTRAATAAGVACSGGPARSHHIAFDGIICIGNTIAMAKYFNRGAPVEPAVEAFPTMAAIHWYHNAPSAQPLEAFAAEAAEFAATDYLAALYQGDALTGERRERIKEKIMYYTGVSSQYLEDRGLRLERFSFCREVLRQRDQVVSIMDGRFTRPVCRPRAMEGAPGYASDAATERYSPFFLGALRGEIFQSLGIRGFDRSFVPSCSLGTELEPNPIWNFETAGLVSGERLSIAMRCNPGMRVLFANGWFDLCTQTGIIRHTVTHACLPRERVYFKGYPSGHMAYIGEDNVRKLSHDIRCFISHSDQLVSIAGTDALR